MQTLAVADEPEDPVADQGLETVCGYGRFLRLSCADQSAGILHGAFENLSRQEDQRGFEDGPQDGEEWQSEQAELDGRHAAFVTRKAAPPPKRRVNYRRCRTTSHESASGLRPADPSLPWITEG
ncbi:hypothetical protein D3C87_1781210 [compost metagenome]